MSRGKSDDVYHEGLDMAEPREDFDYPDFLKGDIWTIRLPGNLAWNEAMNELKDRMQRGAFRRLVGELVFNGKFWIQRVV